ncbi:MAG: flagellar basal body-associated FliL family protein [Candidatus Adiutrix sp.]|jgi:flagellar FliL protein|nr:flagellar basal body-associated FliL family protein [Candidatus Adiutrix sp.]
MAKKEKTPPPAEGPKGKGEDAAEAEAGPEKKGGLKLILLVAAVLLVGLAGGVVAARLFLGGSAPAEAPATEAAAPPAGSDSPNPITAPQDNRRSGEEAPPPAEGEALPAEAAGPINVEFKPFIVNLGDGGGKRFLKLTLSVEAESPEMETEINNKTPQLRDLMLLLLSSLSYDDISTVDGKMRLRSQMLNRINTQLRSGKVRNIYFSEFVVQ